MLGKISLDYIDLFGNGLQPTIRVNIEKGSSDPRDKLLQYLFEDGTFRLSSLQIHVSDHQFDKSKILHLFREDREPKHPYIGTPVMERTEGETFETAMRWMREGHKVKREKGTQTYYLEERMLWAASGKQAGPVSLVEIEDLMGNDWYIVSQSA